MVGFFTAGSIGVRRLGFMRSSHIQSCMKVLGKLYGQDKRVRLEQAAVGDTEGFQYLNILTESKVSNSLLQPNNEIWNEIRYRTGDVLQTSVPAITLDNYMSSENLTKIYLVKIDVQGYEMHVLEALSGA